MLNVYKKPLISTIVDAKANAISTVYKKPLISTIVDALVRFSQLIVYKKPLISTIVDFQVSDTPLQGL